MACAETPLLGHSPNCKGSPVVYTTNPPQYGVTGCTCHAPPPEGSMRVGPGTDAVVWNTCKTHKGRPA